MFVSDFSQKSLFREERKGQAVYSHTISPDITCCVYDVPAITQHVKDMITNNLQVCTMGNL